MSSTEPTPAGRGPSLSVAEGGRQMVGTEEQVVQLVEEVARIDKRLVEERTRVHITVSEHDEAVQAMLMHQDVVVDRVPVGIRVDAVPPVRREGDVVIVPVMEEVLVVEKRLMVREELRIRIDVTRREETRVVQLRREHAEIERDGAAVPSNDPA